MANRVLPIHRGHGMIDPFARRITYLRLSLTDRCDMRCLYCLGMGTTFVPKDNMLSIEDLEWACDGFIRQGIRKIRLTGGEPLLRRGAMTLIARLGDRVRSGHLDELTLTTNGSHLAEHAEALYASGIRRVNVSLDSLDPDTFRRITRCGDLRRVLNGIAAAKLAGLTVRVNTVVLNGINDSGLNHLVAWCGSEGVDLALIEAMPLGSGAANIEPLSVPMDEVRRRLAEHWTMIPDMFRSSGPARYMRVVETGGRIGFISPMTHRFCGDCNRVRLTSTGELYTCLGRDVGVCLRPLIRAQDASALQRAIADAIAAKPAAHAFGVSHQPGGGQIFRHMNVTGG